MKNSKIGLIIIAVIAVIAIILIGGYNSIIAASEEVENKFSTTTNNLLSAFVSSWSASAFAVTLFAPTSFSLAVVTVFIISFS